MMSRHLVRTTSAGLLTGMKSAGRCGRKTLLAALIAAAAASPGARGAPPATAPAPAAAHLPREGLIAHWAGDGNARDSVGKNHGKIGEGVEFTADRHGKAKGAFLFNGRSGFITVPDADSLETDEAFTFSAWIKPQGYVDETGVWASAVLSKVLGKSRDRPKSDWHGDYVFGFLKTGEISLVVMEDNPKGLVDRVSTESVVPKGKWTHVAATFDRGAVTLYINGKLEVSKTCEKVKRLSGAEYEHDEVNIGGVWNDGHNFHGAMDDLAIWKRALTAAEVRAVFLGLPAVPVFLPGLPKEGLVAHWAADGDAKDGAGNHHGKIGEGVSFAADRHGKAKGAFLFNGRSGFVTVPDADALDTDDAFTLSAWIKPRAYQDEAGYYPMILTKWLSSSTHGDYILHLRKEDGRPRLCVGSGTESDVIAALSASPKGAWTHVAATFDRGRMSLYVNGKLEATKVSDKVKRTDPAEYAHDDVKIGGHYSDYYNFHGAIDDVAIWNRALSAEEVRQIFAGGGVAGLAAPVRPPTIQREAAADQVVLGDGQVLKGTIVNDRFNVTASVGRFSLEAAKLAGLARNGKSDRTWVCLNDGQILAGAVAGDTIQLRLSTGATLKIPLASIRQVGWRLPTGSAAAGPAPARLLTLRTGERLIWTSVEEKMSLQTRYGVVPLPPKAVAAVGSVAGWAHWVRFANGTALAGLLRPSRLTFKLALGPNTSVTAGDLAGLAFPTRPVDTTDLAVLVTRRGDRLMGQVVDARLTVRTRFGDAALPPGSVRSFVFNPKQPAQVAATQWDGVVVTGTLVQREVAFRIVPGVEVKVPAADIASITRQTVLPPPEVVEKARKLIAQLGAASYKDREEATKALIAMGKAIVSVLRPHLKSDDPEIRHRVRLILDKLGAGN